jgi:ligand-binding SRPBCC domain-containing protein
MPLLALTTTISAPIERCFDLARSIDFHLAAARRTQETAIRGRTSGLIEAGETVTWRARRLGVWRQLTVAITAFERPRHFRDAMLDGAFSSMWHDHYFEVREGATVMTDRFDYQAPMGVIGRLADQLFLKKYLHRFLADRAAQLKSCAESDEWRTYCESRPETGVDS